MNFTVPVPIFLTSSIFVTLHLTEERPKLMLSGRVTCGVKMQMRAECQLSFVWSGVCESIISKIKSHKRHLEHWIRLNYGIFGIQSLKVI